MDDDERTPDTSSKPRIKIDLRTLRGTPPSMLLRVIYDDDPLDLDLRCKLRLNELGYLMCRERLFLRCGALCAYKGATYDPDIDRPEAWIAKRVDDAIEALIEDDLLDSLKQEPIEYPENYALMIDHLGFTPKIARAVHVSFNDLPQEIRTAYFSCSFSNEHPDAYIKRMGITMDELHAQILIAVTLIIEYRKINDGGQQ
jgi:hypothetical protein